MGEETKIKVGGIMKNTGLATVSLLSVPGRPDVPGTVLHELGKQNINIEFIVHNLDMDGNGSMKMEGGKAEITFTHTKGLTAKGGELKGFAIAGADRKFHFAKAAIRGGKVVEWSDAVKNPVAVRYVWDFMPDCNLYNSAGLPASPFRTDDWPGLTAPEE